MKPVKRKASLRKSQGHCLLCSRKCTSLSSIKSLKRARLADLGVDIPGGDNCTGLANRLEEMFILLKLLDVPVEWYQQMLLKRGESRSEDASWFSVCRDCAEESVSGAWTIHQEIMALQRKMAVIKRRVKEGMRKAIRSCRIKLEEDTFDYELRQFLFPDLFLKTDMAVLNNDDFNCPEEDDDLKADVLKGQISCNETDNIEVSKEVCVKFEVNTTADVEGSEDDRFKSPEDSFICSDFENDDDADDTDTEYITVTVPAAKKSKKRPARQSTAAEREKNRFKWKFCRACISRFNTLPEYDAHRTAHEELGDGGQFVCSQCTFPSRTAEELELHKKLRHKNGAQAEPPNKKMLTGGYDCPRCPLKTETWKDLKLHVDQQHSSMTEEELRAAGLTLNCHLCDGKQFGSLIQFITHRKKVHPETVAPVPTTSTAPSQNSSSTRKKLYQRWKICQKCDARYKTKEEFDAHLKAHDDFGSGEFACVQCTFPAGSQAELERHQRARHENQLGPQRQEKKTYDCAKCPLRTETWKLMNQHVAEEHRSMTSDELLAAGLILKCDLCDGKQFECIQRLTLHRRTVHPELEEDLLEPIECPECGLKFPSRKLLQSHERTTHSRQSKVVCDECGMGFQTSSALKNHQVCHLERSQQQDLICHLCGLDFGSERVLKQHYKKCHKDGSTDKVLKCRYCDLTSPIAAVIRRHLETHKEEMGFRCDQCSKCYTSGQGLARHVRINHSNGSWPCPHCAKAFTCEDYMKAHVRQHCRVKQLEEKKVPWNEASGAD